jgi:type II secretory ATPase GspE/PulE/Tfp pilus assembly ATPase PilB-like protein
LNGTVMDTLRLPSADGKRLVRAFKSPANLDHGQSRVPQDGRVELNAGSHSLHARDGVATITALRNYGLKDFEIAASLDLVVAQRLVRRATGGPKCSMTRYYGRVGIFAVWRLRREEADLIPRHTHEKTLRRRLRRQGMPTCKLLGLHGRSSTPLRN